MYGFNSDRSKVEVPKIYTSSTAPQEGSAGDLWLKVYRDEAYAVFDSSDGSLTIFRDEVGKYTDGQIAGTKTYYAGIEDIEGERSPKWSGSITKVIIEDTFRPKTAYKMFYEESNLTSIEGIENLNMSECTNMGFMFYNCQNLTILDVSHFDTSKVTKMNGVFWGCRNLTELDLSHFDTSNVTVMNSMFKDCSNLTELDLSSFDTSKVTNTNFMFNGCRKLTATLNIMNMPTSHNNMCNGAASSSGAQLTLKYTSPVTSADIDTLVATKGNGNVVNGGPA